MTGARRLPAAALWAVLVAACGYQSVRNGPEGRLPWCVEAGAEPSVHPAAAAAVELGARDALARAGLVGACRDGNRLVVQVVDVDRSPVGVVVTDSGDPGARATRVRVTVAGHVLSEAGRRDLGWVTAEYVVATGSNEASDSHGLEAGVTMAGRQAGELVVARLLGEPVPAPGP